MSSMGFLTDIMAGGISAGAASAMTGAAGQLLGQTATGASQGTAFLMGAPTVEFTTVAAGTGALLPAVTVGGRINGADTILVVNNGANALLVYPPIGFKIATNAVNATVSIASGKGAVFQQRGDSNYFALMGA